MPKIKYDTEKNYLFEMYTFLRRKAAVTNSAKNMKIEFLIPPEN